MSGRDWAALLFLSLLWGASFFFYKILDAALPPMTISLGRVGIGALALNVVLRARGLRLSRALPWGRLTIVGLLSSALPFILFAAAEQHISSSLAALLNAMTPINAVLIAPLFRDGGGWTRWRLLGAASGL
ncbi:EamA family transporter, partial [Endobacter medicaginis]